MKNTLKRFLFIATVMTALVFVGNRVGARPCSVSVSVPLPPIAMEYIMNNPHINTARVKISSRNEVSPVTWFGMDVIGMEFISGGKNLCKLDLSYDDGSVKCHDFLKHGREGITEARLRFSKDRSLVFKCKIDSSCITYNMTDAEMRGLKRSSASASQYLEELNSRHNRAVLSLKHFTVGGKRTPKTRSRDSKSCKKNMVDVIVKTYGQKLRDAKHTV